MSADRFTTKQRLSLLALVLGVASVVFGASYAVEQKNNAELTVSVPETSVASTQKTQVLGTQISKTGAYMVTAGAVETQAGYVRIPVQVTNTSSETIQFAPGLQLRLLGSQTKQIKTVEAPIGANVFSGGPIAAGQTLSGDMYFVPFDTEAYELVFYADVEKDEYASIPAAIQPAAVQNIQSQQALEDKKQKTENESEDD
jgi:hypothetical protein